MEELLDCIRALVVLVEMGEVGALLASVLEPEEIRGKCLNCKNCHKKIIFKK